MAAAVTIAVEHLTDLAPDRRTRWLKRHGPALALLLIGMAVMFLLHRLADTEQKAAQARFREHESARGHEVAAQTELFFAQLYDGLRTIARLNGVRSIDRYGKQFDPNARQAVQEIYNSLAIHVALSEIYLVPADLDPDAPDPLTGEPQAPIVSYDELIVGRTALSHEHGEPKHAGSSPPIEEIEIFEYRQMREQIKSLRRAYPTEQQIDGLRYPATVSHEVITCDNSRYSPEAPDDRDRSGFVYSVPFYGLDGRFKGLVSGVVLTHVVRDLLPDSRYAVVRGSDGYQVAPHATAAAPTTLIHREDIPLKITDQHGAAWALRVALPASSFWADPEVRANQRTIWLAYLFVFSMTMALVFIMETWCRQRAAQAKYQRDLESTVAVRTSALRAALESAKAATAAKAAFLATMSHEIRTPMNGVLGMLDLLRRSPLETRQSDYADLAHRSAQSLSALIDNVLDFSRIEGGELELTAVAIDVAALVGEVVALLQEKAVGKGLTLRVDKRALVDSHVRGDPTRLRQVLLNLISNAVKFTTHGEVCVGLRSHPETDGRFVEFSVRDTGIGVESSHLASLFDPFTQVETGMSRRFEGTGLGLSLSQRLVMLMGGELHVESTPGAGSLFHFALPVTEPSTIGEASAAAVAKETTLHERLYAPASATANVIAERAAAGPLVLLAEDNPVNQTVALAMLENLGVQVAMAQDGLEAVQAFRERDFAAILMDCQMPGLDGLEATRQIRRLEAADGRTHTPVIALTANAMQGDRERCLSAGMDDFVAKPVQQAALAQTLTRWLSRERKSPATLADTV